jgi:hypothetical protein
MSYTPQNGFDKRPEAINRNGSGKGGRTRALIQFDKWLAEDGKGEKLREAWESAFNKDPLKFWREYVVPLLPKEARVEIAEGLPRIRLTLVENVGGQPDSTS